MSERITGAGGCWAQRAPAEHDSPRDMLLVDRWLLYVPGQGVTDFYMLGVISLEDMPGATPAKRNYPQAQFELVVASVDPDPPVDARNPKGWALLEPMNVVQQFHGVTREQARELAALAARSCVDLRLPAETQVYVVAPPDDPDNGKMMYIDLALQAWKDAVRETVEHLRTGGHP